MVNIIKLIRGGYSCILNLYDFLTAEVCIISIGDILLKRANIDSCQFTTSTRFLDVNKYYSNTDKTFPYQNMVSRKVWGAEHKEEKGNKEFESLIKSYEKNGFYIESLFEVDLDFVLLNGTHRSACNLYFGYDIIKVKHLKRWIPRSHNVYHQLALNLKSDFYKEVFEAYENIQDKLIKTGNTFVILVNEEDYPKVYFELRHVVNILRVSKFKSIDEDIPFDGMLIQCSISCPNYYSKNGIITSKYAQKLKEMYQKIFPKVIVSTSCYEGKLLFQKIKLISEKEGIA